MSYDLYVFPRRAGEDAEATYEALVEAQEADETLGEVEELDGRWGEYGGQIEMYDDGSAAASLAYWHEAERAREAFVALAEGLEQLRSRLGEDLVVWDPQLEQEVDVDRDLEKMLDTYSGGRTVVRELEGDAPPRRKRFFFF